MPPKENPQTKGEQPVFSQGNGLFDDDPFAGVPDPFGEYNPPVEKDNFDPDFGPSGFNGKEFTAMTPAEQEAYNKDVAAIMDELSKTHTVNDDKLHEVLLDASKHGMLYYPNGEMVSEQNLETLFETLPYVYDANPDRAAYAFSDFIVVEYNPVTEGITDRTFDIDDGSVSMDKAKFLEVEDVYKEKYRYKERLARREEINARREATVAENAANRVALQQAVEETIDVPAEETEEDVNFAELGPETYKGVEFGDMTEEQLKEYNDGVADVLKELSNGLNVESAALEKVLVDATAYGMLYYPDGKEITAQEVTAVMQKVRQEPSPDKKFDLVSDIIVTEYNPVEDTLGFLPLLSSSGNVLVHNEHGHYLDEEKMHDRKHQYEEKLARRKEEAAREEGERVARQEAESAAQQEAQYAALQEEERDALFGENSASAEEKAAKPFEFTRPIAVENADGEIRSKRFDEMTPEEQGQFFSRNESILRALETSETEEDILLCLNGAANRGFLFRRDGSAVTRNAVADEINKINETIDKVPFLSDLVFANYNPITHTLGFHPFIVESDKMVVNSAKPLSQAEMEQLYKVGIDAPAQENNAPVQTPAAPVKDNTAEVERINRLSPKELVEELAASVQALDTAKSNAITDKLKALGLYHDLSYTTSDGVKHEKGYVSVKGEAYLRGESKPTTPDALTRFVEGVQPPKKPSGFFSGVREWWHKHVSKLDDFTKYEERMKEYEITRYYTCVKAGLNVVKPHAVVEYEREVAVDMYLDAGFEKLTAEWSKQLLDSDVNALGNQAIRGQLREKLLKDDYFGADFTEHPATRKYLSQNYGANFKIFGENGRKPDTIDADTKNAMIAVGESVVQRNQWDFFVKYTQNDADKAVYTALGRVAAADNSTKRNAEFMKDLETEFRKGTPVSEHLMQKLPTFSMMEINHFCTSTSLNQYAKPNAIEIAAVHNHLLPEELATTVLNKQCEEWLKPFDELAQQAWVAMSLQDGPFINEVKSAFLAHPEIVDSFMQSGGKLDLQFVRSIKDMEGDYLRLKENSPSFKGLGDVGVLEMLAHKKLLGPYAPKYVGEMCAEKVADRFQKMDGSFKRSDFWEVAEVEEWSNRVVNMTDMKSGVVTKQFADDFLKAVVEKTTAGRRIMKEAREAQWNSFDKFVDVARDYHRSDKLGSLSALDALARTGLFSEATVKEVVNACRLADSSYVSPLANVKKPSQMSTQERVANAQKGTENIKMGQAEEQKASGVQNAAEQKAPVEQKTAEERVVNEENYLDQYFEGGVVNEYDIDDVDNEGLNNQQINV